MWDVNPSHYLTDADEIIVIVYFINLACDWFNGAPGEERDEMLCPHSTNDTI